MSKLYERLHQEQSPDDSQVTIQDLQRKLNETKRDLQDLKGHVSLLENKRDKSNGNKPSSSSLDLLLEVNEISHFHFRRWYTKVMVYKSKS